MIWNLIAGVLGLAFVVLSVILIKKTNELKTKYDVEKTRNLFEPDLFLEEKETLGNSNKIYANKHESNEFIDKYIINYDQKTPYLLCHQIKPINAASILEVFCYNEKNKLISVIQTSDSENSLGDNLIELTKGTMYINLIIRHQKETLHSEDYYTMRSQEYKKMAQYVSFVLFILLVPLSYLILNLLINELTESTIIRFMTVRTIVLGFALIVITCLINYRVLLLWIYRSNKNRGDFSE